MPGPPIGSGVRSVGGIETLFQWDEDGEQWDVPWDDDLRQEIQDQIDARATPPEEPEEGGE